MGASLLALAKSIYYGEANWLQFTEWVLTHLLQLHWQQLAGLLCFWGCSDDFHFSSRISYTTST